MSGAPSEMPPVPTSDSKSKKKKKSKKKNNAGTHSINEDTNSPVNEEPVANAEADNAVESEDSGVDESDTAKPTVASTETSLDEESTLPKAANGVAGENTSEDATARFDALVKDRDALRAEVTQLRESLQEWQTKHETELETVQTQLQETQDEKEHAEEQYQALLGKVNTIRSQLGERLKADAEELAQARTLIEELEEQKSDLQEQYTARSREVEELTSQQQENSRELSTLRNRVNISQQNWLKEKEELVEQEAFMREEFENAKQAMHDWEVLAMEERTIRRDLAERLPDLEEQLESLRESYEKVKDERDSQSGTVEGLQRALQEIQTLRKTELKEVVENSQKEIESIRRELQEVQRIAETSKTESEETKKDLERVLPFEKEVKEKNLLIGKLRHEAVILNDHLTKALRFLKKGKPEDNVDRQIVTNHFLHFLTLDRSDPKKFQILQLIASLLGWNDDQREQAGLARPGGGGGGTSMLRLPGSPLVHRTPSTPALSQESYPSSATSPSGKESLAELWQNFLEQEAGTNNAARANATRTLSQSTASNPPPKG